MEVNIKLLTELTNEIESLESDFSNLKTLSKGKSIPVISKHVMLITEATDEAICKAHSFYDKFDKEREFNKKEIKELNENIKGLKKLRNTIKQVSSVFV